MRVTAWHWDGGVFRRRLLTDLAVISLYRAGGTGEPVKTPKPRGRPFPEGRSGNPKGRPRGALGAGAPLKRAIEAGDFRRANEIVQTAIVEEDIRVVVAAFRLLKPALRERKEPYELPVHDSASGSEG